jgi:hypothetical protein
MFVTHGSTKSLGSHHLLRIDRVSMTAKQDRPFYPGNTSATAPAFRSSW